MPAVVSLRSAQRSSARDVFVDAAERVAAEDGVAKASLQSIAKAAGVAVGTIYNYFEDRQELFDELFARRREELRVAIAAAAERDARQPFAVQLEGFVRTVFEHFDRRRAFLRIALESDGSRPVVVRDSKGRRHVASLAALQTRAEQIMRAGVHERRLREGSASFFATVLVGVLRGVLVADAWGDAPLARRADAALDVFLHGVAR